ncbi:MAG: response regulator [Rickettsiales bacterium]|nr:response regulator [Pseudomonadota bacterium]MDA0967435.1 response regulator [Pseudomonadota bacterium]MDG4544197.1 response regulator [Rickettsiales bacterium]MDG4546378.1 response regulator [Rickettsiales bacterium]MDG4548521.1 response regulator [Rickettsiales bacterium]
MTKEKDPTVLIIEDNKMFRDLAFDVFDNTDRITAKDANEGLTKFKEQIPDITLLDIGLPDRSGLDILPEMVAYNPEAFIVMLTKSNIKKDVEQAKRLGAKGYISKPFTYKKVLDCMDMYKTFKAELEKKSENERFHRENTQEFFEEQEIENNKKIEEHKLKLYEDMIREQISNLSILFVDDYPSNRFKAKNVFAKMGCNIKTANNGEEAVEIYKQGNFNIIFMDSAMDDISGYTATKRIRKYEKENKLKRSLIIGMPEYSNEIEDKLWLQSDMDDYITKPAKIYKVKDIIRKYIEDNLK